MYYSSGWVLVGRLGVEEAGNRRRMGEAAGVLPLPQAGQLVG